MSKRANTRSVDTTIAEEVRRLVAEAVAKGGIMSIADGVAMIVAAVPRSGLSKRQIGDELMMAAVAAGNSLAMSSERIGGWYLQRTTPLECTPVHRMGRPHLRLV